MSGVGTSGRFELKREIGRGAMSTVWEAEDGLTRSPVAIKSFRFPPGMDATQRTRLLQRCQSEVEAASRINHPNVVGVYGAWEAEEGFYIAMELVRGVSLRERLRMEGRLGEASAAGVGIQLCDALGAAHALGIVHCDLKPENILLQATSALEDRVKLVDFGVAQASRGTGEAFAVWGGSPAYMSPEQATGNHIDRRSDIFSLGVVLFEMLTGRAAFEGDSVVAVVHKVVNEPLEVSCLPFPFRGIVAKATEKRPFLRFSSAAEIKGALDTAIHSG